MSYLNPLRLHFAGQFQANVSTVNNDPAHFDNAAFILPDYQELNGPGMNPPNGWFNPQGDAAWRLLGCTVTAAWLPTGAAEASDPVLTAIVADSNTQAPAKLVDLDSEQQLVSEIWGLQVRIADANGNNLLVSDFEAAAFADIWDRAMGQEAGGDVDAGAMYQSVLTNLQWSDVSGSKFLTKLQEAASDGLLSIKFNVDNINMDNTSPSFMCGRIVGTIGPAAAAEPQHMVIGRQFMTAAAPPPQPPAPPPNFFAPAGGINFCAAVVESNTVFVDLGNALNTSGTDGTMIDIGDLTLGVYDPLTSPSNPAGSVISLGTLPSTVYTTPTWYPTTAGIWIVSLTDAQVQAIAAAQLVLSSTKGNVIAEWASGAFVRADTFVYRMSPGQTPLPQVNVYATQWGQPLVGANVGFAFDNTQLQAQAGSMIMQTVPQPGTPTSALDFHGTATTDQNGIAVLAFSQINDPLTPRWFNNGTDYGMDGQVYGIRPSLTDPQYTGPVNQWNFISILLWSGFTAADPVTWTDVEPIFVQYANLYPVMNRFLNLADYDAVVANAGLLTLAFGLDPTNPNAMPVTRDLSPAKRQAILAFLAKPLPAVTKAAAPEAAEGAEAKRGRTPTVGAELARKGGKAAAAGRRLAVVAAKSEASA